MLRIKSLLANVLDINMCINAIIIFHLFLRVSSVSYVADYVVGVVF